MYSDPLAYLLTFRTFGTWHPGDERGSANRSTNCFGERGLLDDEKLASWPRGVQKGESFVLNAAARAVVDGTLREACTFRNWGLLAMNVRTNHVHAVVWPDSGKESMMNTFKSRCTRVLREAGLVSDDTRVWSRHGSTRLLFCPRSVTGACFYVRSGQGEDLAQDNSWWERFAVMAESQAQQDAVGTQVRKHGVGE